MIDANTLHDESLDSARMVSDNYMYTCTCVHA